LENPLPLGAKKPGIKALLTNLPKINIVVVGAVAFYRHIRRKDTEVFITSLHEIDRIIKIRKLNLQGDPDSDLIEQRLPTCYTGYEDAFSKDTSDQMPPTRTYNHRIDLKEGTMLKDVIGYMPLWKQTTKELEAAKQYIVENLDKGFIAPGNALFASPFLMARKPGGGLQFCVDYQKLNAVTKKDRYPLPLVNELMQHLGKAKVFTKLDI
jgi:hypothetical protein